MDLFGRKRKRLYKAHYNAMNGINCYYHHGSCERNEYNKTMQKIEDDMIDHDISLIANERLKMLINAPIVNNGKDNYRINPIFIPYTRIYKIHDESTAKYLNTNIGDLVWDEYQKLKSNHLHKL